MRIANVSGRLSILRADGVIDVEDASGGQFSSDAQAVFERWDEFRAWASRNSESVRDLRALARDQLEAPVPAPRQVIGIGLNYRGHALESGMELPTSPLVFAKFPSSIVGPGAVVELPSDAVDFEAELVVVIGRHARRVREEDAWDHVAGLTLGQDLSERVVQFDGSTPQFSLGKSFPGFSPIGPCIATVDEFASRDDIELGCRLNGREMQRGSTSDLVFSIAELIASLSATLTLLPGDLIFTGTPSGIGWARDPKVLLAAGDELVTFCDQIGDLTVSFVAPGRHDTA